MEQWIIIDDFPNYEVSSLGRIRNVNTKLIIKPWSSNSGYLMVGLRRSGVKYNQYIQYIHRLVADTFFDGYHDKLEVNHIDGDKENNCIWNLEWCTPSGNIRHAIDAGLFTPYKLPPYKKEGVRVRIVETGEKFESLSECAKHIGGFKTAISACLLGKVNTHMGYHFERV